MPLASKKKAVVPKENDHWTGRVFRVDLLIIGRKTYSDRPSPESIDNSQGEEQEPRKGPLPEGCVGKPVARHAHEKLEVEIKSQFRKVGGNFFLMVIAISQTEGEEVGELIGKTEGSCGEETIFPPIQGIIGAGSEIAQA